MPFSIEPNKTYKASRKSVEQALKLLQENRNKRKRTHQEDENQRKITSHCTNFHLSRRKKRTSTTPFSKHLVLSQMRSYAMRHNWQHFKRLFPMLFERSNEIEPLVWRDTRL
ncbi:hypothetical protein KM043_008526 [Ampulex compressa]|nr:hypothetical protein KM043_008526 [Ampulex compressa]